VSEVAVALASIAPLLPAVTRKHLAALLSHTIAAPKPEEIRGRRLGLVCELVSASEGLGVKDYERIRTARCGEGWPAVSTLIEHFGSWPTVLTLAMRLQFEGHPTPVRSSHRPFSEGSRHYSREEVMDAIDRAADVIGRIPSLSEYTEIRRVLIAHARRTGNVAPRMPERGAIARRFSSYQDAARATARRSQR
jgi:hypothetical protein